MFFLRHNYQHHTCKETFPRWHIDNLRKEKVKAVAHTCGLYTRDEMSNTNSSRRERAIQKKLGS